MAERVRIKGVRLVDLRHVALEVDMAWGRLEEMGRCIEPVGWMPGVMQVVMELMGERRRKVEMERERLMEKLRLEQRVAKRAARRVGEKKGAFHGESRRRVH